MHTKRASATRGQSCDFGPLARHFPRGATKGVFERGEIFSACIEVRKTHSWVRFPETGGPKLENACPFLPFGHVTTTWGPKDRARIEASIGTQLICICKFFTKKSQDKVSLGPYPGDAIEMSLSNGGDIVETFFFSILDLPGWHFSSYEDCLRRKRRYRGKSRAWHFFSTGR